LIKDFLKGRGLELSDEKTIITHIDTGFDFLGWNSENIRANFLSSHPRNPLIKLLRISVI